MKREFDASSLQPPLAELCCVRRARSSIPNQRCGPSGDADRPEAREAGMSCSPWRKKSRLCRPLCGRAGPFRNSGSRLNSSGSAACRKAAGFLPRPRRDGAHSKRRSRIDLWRAIFHTSQTVGLGPYRRGPSPIGTESVRSEAKHSGRVRNPVSPNFTFSRTSPLRGERTLSRPDPSACAVG